jgi:hypothetical protein
MMLRMQAITGTVSEVLATLDRLPELDLEGMSDLPELSVSVMQLLDKVNKQTDKIRSMHTAGINCTVAIERLVRVYGEEEEEKEREMKMKKNKKRQIHDTATLSASRMRAFLAQLTRSGTFQQEAEIKKLEDLIHTLEANGVDGVVTIILLEKENSHKADKDSQQDEEHHVQ